MSALRFSLVCALPFLALGACARARGPGPGDPGQEAQRHRAALAFVTVQNGTARRLQIAFRPAVGPGEDVIVGEVGPDSTASLAPVPAGEPIVLSAIDADSSRLALRPRSFDLNERWTWVIPPAADFLAPERPE